MKINKVVIVLVIAALIYIPGIGLAEIKKEDGTNDKMDLKRLITIAFNNNPKLKAAKRKWEGVIEKYPQVTSYEDPVIQYSYFLKKVETRVGPQRQKFSLYQKIPFPGKLSLKGDIVVHEIRIAKLEFEKATRKLIVKLKKGYLELVYINRAIKLIQQNKELAENLARIGTADYSVDGTTLNDVFKAQSELAQLSYDLILLSELRETEITNINSILNSPPESPLEVLSNVDYRPFKYKIEELYKLAAVNQQELNISQEMIEKTKKIIRLAKKEYLPNFNIGLSYIDVGDANTGAPADSGKDAYSVNIGITVPLWLSKKNARVAEARMKEEELIYLKKEMENKTNSDIKRIFFKINNSERLVRLYRDSLIPQAEQSMEVAETWYKEKQGSFASLLETRGVWLNFQLASFRALTDYYQRIAQLEELAGVSLPFREGE